MGRPTEKSLSFFNHDTDARGDRKHKLFIRYTGLPGYGFYWAILEDIYNEDYFIEWTREDQQVFVADFHSPFYEVSYEDVSQILQKAFDFGLLDESLYREYEILTSPAIQRRWLKAQSRRVLAEMRDDFVLINIGEFYEKELKNANLSIKVVDKNGDVVNIYGDYVDNGGSNGVSVDNNSETGDNNVDNPEDEYDEEYDFSCEYPWDEQQPIDYKSCIETWNKITGGQARTSRIPKSKKIDLRRVFRNYTGRECFEAMHVRAEDEMMKNSKYLTDWSTLYGAKRLENLDKWVGRAREWRQDQQKMESVKDHIEAGWKTQEQAKKISNSAAVEFEDPMFWETKKVESQLLYYPKFNY